MLTESFDAPLPVGQAFQIRGAAAPTVVGVIMQSMGYQHRAPAAFRQVPPDTAGFCVALRAAARDAGIHYTELGWDRSGTAADEFALTHPRLYYGRNYVFVFTYLHRVDPEQLRLLLQPVLSRLVAGSANFESLLSQGLTKQALQTQITAAIDHTRAARRSCLPSIVERDLREGTRFWSAVGDSLLTSIATLATRQGVEQRLAAATALAETALRGLPAELPQQVREGLAPTGLLAALEAPPPPTDRNWSAVDATLENIAGAVGAMQGTPNISRTSIQAAVDAVNRVRFTRVASVTAARSELADLPENSPDDVARFVASRWNPDSLTTLLYVGNAAPYHQTMREALPFMVSLDGGLAYVARFRQLVPTVALNVKLARVDFDDPFNRRPEFSVLLGLGMASPDDIDPDYEGIFGGSSRSLLLGLGLRPSAAPLFRATVGILLFRQHDRNPLQDELHTRASLVVGGSINWDVADFAATLAGRRPTLGVGGL